MRKTFQTRCSHVRQRSHIVLGEPPELNMDANKTIMLFSSFLLLQQLNATFAFVEPMNEFMIFQLACHNVSNTIATPVAVLFRTYRSELGSMGKTLEMSLRVQIGVERYLMFNSRPSGAESAPSRIFTITLKPRRYRHLTCCRYL